MSTTWEQALQRVDRCGADGEDYTDCAFRQPRNSALPRVLRRRCTPRRVDPRYVLAKYGLHGVNVLNIFGLLWACGLNDNSAGVGICFPIPDCSNCGVNGDRITPGTKSTHVLDMAGNRVEILVPGHDMPRFKHAWDS